MKHFRIRKHDDFQHYSNRNPPWIKLHTCLLGSINFLSLSDASRWQALGCALLASRYQNHLPADPAFLKAELHSKSPINIEALFEAKFIVWCTCEECASTALADCKQVARPEQRRERAEGEERRADTLSVARQPTDEVSECWKVYTDHRERHFIETNGSKPPAAPTLTTARRKLIRRAIREHGFRKAKVAPAGMFLSEFHLGKNDRNTTYIGPEHAWKMPNTAGNGPDNVETFSGLYFEWEAKQ